uniref:Cytochrome c oxidase assembly protein COX16 homolog, mitochondrial n=1 Tax=Denticeps clupeoides TaxID=299321 RepID=A0AAY4A1U9_9TELE
MWSRFRYFQKNKTVKYGVPMLVLVVGGSFGLREFTQIRYDAQKIRKRLDPSLEARVNTQKQSVVLEQEYEVRLLHVDYIGRTSVVLGHGKTPENIRSSRENIQARTLDLLSPNSPLTVY